MSFISTLAGGGAALLLLPVVHLLVGAQAVAVVSVSTLLALPERAYLLRDHINWSIAAWFLPSVIIGA